MIMLGRTAKHLRETKGLTQREAAEQLGITVVHLSNIENNKSMPSPALVDRYRELWGVDLHVLAWCMFGDIKKLPAAIRKPAEALAKAWREQLGCVTQRMESTSSCSTSGR